MQLMKDLGFYYVLLIFIVNMRNYKIKKGIKVTNVFRRILGESNRKPKKVWVDKSSEFYNRSIK